ncbi:MAG: FAD-binding oxidoreductase [Caldilineaceae bacterium]
MQSAHYEYIVVGNGLMGSAATRYLSQWSDRVALIGPGEPADHSRHEGVFSSHYDEGRLAHKHSQDPIWDVISRAAVAVYPELEAQSGITFHGPTGRVIANRFSAEEQALIEQWIATVDPAGETLRFYPASDRSWEALFPFLTFPAGYSLLHELAPAGYVNPRAMLRAQNAAAQQQGCTIIDQLAVEVQSSASGVTVKLANGKRLGAKKVLIAAGAFTNFHGLLPRPLPLLLKTEATIWADVAPETAERLRTMPAVGYNIDDPDIDDIYMAPPLRYPDGQYKIKLGCNTKGELWPATLTEVQAWFQRGDSDCDKPAMERALKRILPEVAFGKITSHRCIVTYTPSGYPMIDSVPSDEHGRLFVATGGNGSGAAGSDTLGLLAAGLLHDGRWIDGLPREPFLATNQWGQSKKVLTKAQKRALEKMYQ